MLFRTAFLVALAAAAAPALAQTADPAAPTPPAAGDAPKPYVPPAATAPAETPAKPAAPVPAADPASQQAAETLPTQVEDVQVVGPWSDGAASGVWRTVMMQVGGADKDVYRFFVQKLDRVGPGAKVISTTEIREVAGVDGAVVGYRAEEPDEGDGGDGAGTEGATPAPAQSDLTLFFDVVPSSGEIPETYELHFMKDLTYTFGPASN